MTQTRRLTILAATLMSIAVLGVEVDAKKDELPTKLPDAVAKVFQDEFPGAEIIQLDAEKEGGVQVYDIEFRGGGSEGECDIAADGSILNAATVVGTESVPEVVMKAFTRAADGGTVGRIEKAEIRAEAKGGTITRLDEPRIEFEAEIEKGGRHAEITVALDGAVVEAPNWVKGRSKERRDRE